MSERMDDIKKTVEDLRLYYIRNHEFPEAHAAEMLNITTSLFIEISRLTSLVEAGESLIEAGNFLYEKAMAQVAEQQTKIELLQGVIKSSAEYCKTCIYKKGTGILDEQIADLTRQLAEAKAETRRVWVEFDEKVELNKEQDKSMLHHALDSCEQFPGLRIAWLIERSSSLWGIEWFCAGTDRWTKDANKAILFPDKASAEETATHYGWSELPTDMEGGDPGSCSWVYHLSITEHGFIGG